MVGTWPKPATSKLSLVVRVSLSARGTGSAAARAAAAGEAGEPSDGGPRPVVHRRVGRRGRAGGGGIHRCGSLRADDCGLIDRRRAVFSWGRSTLKRASAPTRETYKGRFTRPL